MQRLRNCQFIIDIEMIENISGANQVFEIIFTTTDKEVYDERDKTNETFVEKFLNIAIDLESMSIAYHGIDVAEIRYDATPKNALVFASTGVDGCHYCVVPKQGVSIDESPIYHVSPMDWESTVVWVAKDFIDFLSIGVAMGSFTYAASCHTVDKNEFEQLIEESWLEDDITKKMNAIKQLQKYFPLTKYEDIYEYVTESYTDVNNHVNLEFVGVNLNASTLGNYDMV